MKNYYPHFGQEETGIVSAISDVASTSLDTSLDKFSKLTESAEIQQVISDLGLTPYIKDVTKDRVKTLLSFFGLIYISKKLKSPITLLALSGLAGYMVYSNQDKVIEKVSDKVA